KNSILESLSLVRGKLKSQTVAGDRTSLEVRAKQLETSQKETLKNLELLEEQLKSVHTEKTRVSGELSGIDKRLRELNTLLNQPDLVSHWPKISQQIEALEKEFETFFLKLQTALSLEEVKAVAFSLKSSVSGLKNEAAQIHTQ